MAGEVSIHDPAGRRLCQCGPGDVIEPWAAFSEHPAESTAEARSACRTMMLSPAAMHLLQRDDNELALKLSAYLIKARSMPGDTLSPLPR